VSQTDVIRYLLEHNHELGPILDLQAENAAGHALLFSDQYLDTAAADRLKHTPATIPINNPAWAGLQKMSTTHASCVAVVGMFLLRLLHLRRELSQPSLIGFIFLV
jgi:hypothetical protein